MTVAELIAALQQLPPDLPVVVNQGRGGAHCGEVAKEVQKRIRWDWSRDANDWIAVSVVNVAAAAGLVR